MHSRLDCPGSTSTTVVLEGLKSETADGLVSVSALAKGCSTQAIAPSERCGVGGVGVGVGVVGGSHHAPSDDKVIISISRCRRRNAVAIAAAAAASGKPTAVLPPPPRLKRDTDSADLFVNLLIAFACKLITAMWPLSATPPTMMSNCFHGSAVIPLHTFIYETLRRSKTSYSTLQIALYYLILLKPSLSRLHFNHTDQPCGAPAVPSAPESESSASPSASPASASASESESAPSPSPSATATATALPGKDARGCRALQCGRRMFLSALILASKYIQDRNYSTRAWSKISGLRIPEINENERQYLRFINYSLHIKQTTFENWTKVVLLLSRVSKIQPASFDLSHRAGHQSSAAPFSTRYPQHSTATIQGLYTRDWWTRLCNDLDSSTFQDSAKTDAFIMEHIPPDMLQHAPIIKKS